MQKEWMPARPGGRFTLRGASCSITREAYERSEKRSVEQHTKKGSKYEQSLSTEKK
jgi:hypothetical protein